MKTWPESGMIAPVMALIKVDLPAPLSPITASTSPGNRSTSTPSRPMTFPNVLINFRADNTVSFGSASSGGEPSPTVSPDGSLRTVDVYARCFAHLRP